MSRRFREYYPQEDSPEFFGDRGFVGLDARLAPEKLPEGFLSRAVNVWLEDGQAVTRPGVAFADWSLVKDGAPDFRNPDDVYPGWIAGLTYSLGTKVAVAGHTWECAVAEDVPASEAALTSGGNWTDLGAGYVSYQLWGHVEARLRHACALVWGSEVPWVARAYAGEAFLSRAGSEPVVLAYPSGATAPAGSRLVAAWGQLWLFRGVDLEPLVWEGEATGGAFVAASTVWAGESSEGTRLTATLPGGQVALEHRGRLLVGRGEELVVSDILEGVYAPTESVEAMPGGAGKVTALLAYGPDVLVFRERGIFRVSGLDTVDAWTITPITMAKGAVGPDAVVVAGREVWFWADDGIYSISQVGDQGENRLGVGDHAASLPVGTLIRDLLSRQLVSEVRAAVVGPRVLWAVPVGMDNEGQARHRVLVWRQDGRVWEALWAQATAVADDANYAPDPTEAEPPDWQVGAWVQLAVDGVETLVSAGDAGLWHWLDGVYDDCLPWEEGDGLAQSFVAMRVRSRGLGWDIEGTRTGQRLRIEGGTWAPSLSFDVLLANGERCADPLGPRTHSAAKGIKAGMAPFTTSNVNDDHGADAREDYALDLAQSTALHTVTEVDSLRLQQFVWHVRAPGDSRYFQIEVKNDAGVVAVASLGLEAKVLRRSSTRRA
jgi:hypothetical protein